MTKQLNFKQIVIVVILWIAIVAVMAFTFYKVDRFFYKKSVKKATQEMVTSGELTQKQADAFMWLIFEYKPKKK